MKIVRLIKMCINETYVKVRIGKHLSDTFPIQNGLIQGDALFPLKFNGTCQLLVYADDVNLLGDNTDLSIYGSTALCWTLAAFSFS
jgi:hypothetical protein